MKFDTFTYKDYDSLIGKTVLCRLYNSIDGQYLGDFFVAVILHKEDIPDTLIGVIRDFTVRRTDNKILTIWMNEIRGILQE